MEGHGSAEAGASASQKKAAILEHAGLEHEHRPEEFRQPFAGKDSTCYDKVRKSSRYSGSLKSRRVSE
jgi:hypothetical protein